MTRTLNATVPIHGLSRQLAAAGGCTQQAAELRRVHLAGDQRVNPEALAGALERGGTSQPDHSVLGRRTVQELKIPTAPAIDAL